MRVIDAWINDVSLREVDPRIVLRRIDDAPPTVETTWGDNPGRDGQRMLGRRRTNRRVTLTFGVRELYDLAARARIVDAVNAWAQDGFLKVSNRPERRLPVKAAQYAVVQDPRNYNEDFSVAFDSPFPFWEDSAAKRVQLTGSSAAGQIKNLGSAPALCGVTVSHASGTLNTLSITVGHSTFSFSSLGVGAGTDLVIDHDANGYLRIMAGTTSKLARRSAASGDELVAMPGINEITLTANVSVTAVVEVRAAWL